MVHVHTHQNDKLRLSQDLSAELYLGTAKYKPADYIIKRSEFCCSLYITVEVNEAFMRAQPYHPNTLVVYTDTNGQKLLFLESHRGRTSVEREG